MDNKTLIPDEKAKTKILAKILMWCFDNGIEVKISKYDPPNPGLRSQIQMDLIKNGRHEYIRLYDFEELTQAQIQGLIEHQALKLCLTRLVL